MTVLETLNAYNLKKEVRITGIICRSLLNYVSRSSDDEKLRKKAIKILDFIAPVKLLADFPKTNTGIVLGFNHPSLGEIFRLISLGFKYYPERNFLFPVNLPWFEELMPVEDKLNRMGVYIRPMITPSTETKLKKMCEGDPERLKKIQNTKVMYERQYMRTAKKIASEGSLIFVAPSATRQAEVISDHIHPTMTILAHMIYKGSETNTIFLPVTVFEPKHNNRMLNLFKTYGIYPCEPFSAAEVKELAGNHSRDFDRAFLTRIDEIYKNRKTATNTNDFDKEDLGTFVVKTLIEKGLTISAAESMTGGLFAKSVTDVPGASAIFKSSYVTYSEEEKSRILGVDMNLIKTHGVVSKEVAISMAQGLNKLTGSDICISVTGYAGPDGDDVGLFYIGLCYKGKTVAFEHRSFKYSREYIRGRAVHEMFAAIYTNCNL